jgi:hypothetical protein
MVVGIRNPPMSLWISNVNPQGDGAVESHVSQRTRNMGHPFSRVGSGVKIQIKAKVRVKGRGQSLP